MSARPNEEVPVTTDVDVVVVGAGPAGQATAFELADRGLRVLVLEAGGPEAVDPARVRGIARGLPYPYSETVDEGVGGTARLWCVDTPDGPDRVRFRALDPVDLAGRPELGVPAWPLAYAELERWYPRARALVGLPAHAPTMGVDPIETATGHRVESAVFEFPDKRCFTSVLPAELKRRGVTLRWHQRVEAIVSEPSGDGGRRVTGLRVRDGREGRVEMLTARRVVLAGGAVPTAHLLATSDALLAPQVLGRVGVGFMEHLHANVAMLVPADESLLRDTAITGMHRVDGQVVERRYHLSAEIEREHALLRTSVRWAPGPRHRGLDARAFGSPDAPGITGLREARDGLRAAAPGKVARGARAAVSDRRSVARHLEALARHSLREVRGRNRPIAVAVAVTEQRRELRRRVVLDRGGPPEVLLDVDRSEVEELHRTLEILGRELRQAGLGSLYPLFRPPHLPHNLGWGHHHMGTAVMSRDPDTGVVDPDLAVHGVAGLHVASSAVFPSGGHANPTLTILALACRLADHLTTPGER